MNQELALEGRTLLKMQSCIKKIVLHDEDMSANLALSENHT